MRRFPRLCLWACLLAGLARADDPIARTQGDMTPSAPARPQPYGFVAFPADALSGGDMLRRLLAEHQRPADDLTPYLQAGYLPLSGVKALYLGSFCNNDPRLRGTLWARRAALEQWLRDGGVLIELCQQDATQPADVWLPGGLMVTRQDADYGVLRWRRADHPLATTPHRLDDAATSGWRYRNWGVVMEGLSGWGGFELIADGGDPRAGAIVEGAYGKGRILAMAVAPEGMAALGEGDTPAKARRLFDNLDHYVELLVAGQGVALSPTPTLLPVRGPGLGAWPVLLFSRPGGGLAAMLRGLGVRAATGRVPKPGAKALVLLDAGAAETLAPEQLAGLRRFAEAGGVVTELAQNLDERPLWLPAAERAGRGGMPAEFVVPDRADHPLFLRPNLLGEQRRGSWRAGALAIARQPFGRIVGWGVVARFGGQTSPSAVLERRVAKGRAILVAADLGVAAADAGLTGDNARAFLANLLRYACDTALGRAPLAPPAKLPDRSGMLAGRQVDGSVMVPTDQLIVPAGRQVEFNGRPVDLALLPGGDTLAVVDRLHLRLLDVDDAEIAASAAVDGGHSVGGIAVARDGRRLYTCSAKGPVQVWLRDAAGRLSAGEKLKLPTGVGAGLLLSADEKTLYVCGSTANTLVALDLAGGAPRSLDVGMAPYAVARAGGRLYVSNWGGRRPKPGETTALSAGSPVVVDPRTIGSSGTVSVIDEATFRLVGEVEVGLLPSGLAVSPTAPRLYVANANSDSVSVVDTGSDRVVETIGLRPDAGLPFGSATNALCVSRDGARLYVANGTNNAVAQVTLGDAAAGRAGAAPSRLDGTIPTGWYPGAVVLSARGDQLYVANVKGVGSLAAGARHNSHQHQGSISLIQLPDAAELARLTEQTRRNNRLNLALSGLEPPRPGVAAVPLPERHGEPSLIRHVIYIIRENRTYDQVLGDMPQGNGDDSLVHFGRTVTPNAHALAEQFGLLDNFYCSGVLSADGHQWTDEAYASSYLERMFGGFFRSYPYEGNDALAYSAGGFLWDNALAHGRTFRTYGEMVAASIKPLTAGKKADFRNLYDDFMDNGKLDHFEVRAKPSIQALKENLCETVIGFPGTVPDIYRASEFIRELRGFEQTGGLPNLCMLLLPCDHTAGVNPGFPTPRAAVADNDLALGRIVDAVSHSRFWPETAIFVCEDDPQAGIDHVDGHRSPALVISPWAPRGKVISHNYTQVGMVKTIEMVLGLPPMNQLDLAAEPLRGCFTGEPDLRPYTALPNQIPLDELNPSARALSGSALRWALRSMELNFAEVDEADEDTLNQILWHACKGWDTPYPKWALLRGEPDDD